MRILFIGPHLFPITGNSYAFNAIVQHYKSNSSVIYNGKAFNESFIRKFLNSFKYLISTLYVLIIKPDIQLVYLSGSLSTYGHIKDISLIMVSILFRKKVIVHYHSAYLLDLINKELPYFIKKISNFSLNKIDVFIGLLPEMKEIYQPFLHSNNKYEFVLNFYSANFDSVNNYLSNKEPLIISYFSNLLATKGIMELLEAFDNISYYSSINIELQIAGNILSDSNMSANDLKNKINYFLNKNSKIKYLGSITNENSKIEFLSKSSIFVLPTYYKLEGVPISIIEAMRTGNIIITTKFAYLPFIVKAENGLCVEPKSVSSIEKAILCVINKSFEERRAIQQYNIEFATDHYSLSKHLSKIDSIFSELLSKQK